MGDERQADAIRTDELYNETYRPQFHFTARQNWLNDPNGLVYYQGEYHLFFQHNPQGIDWGHMTWGHAVSKDLVHWEPLPHAIEPDARGTIFSGSAVVDWHNTAGFQKGNEKTLVAIYTAAGGTSPESQGQPFTQCIAYSTDRGRTWTKYAGNPVLQHVVAENRDPKVVWHAPTRRWIMALYLDKNDFGFFASPDLKTWQHLHDITVPDCAECPDFFEMPVDDPQSKIQNPKSETTKWVWTAANGRYLLGAFDGTRFTPETPPLQVEYGANCYAVQTYSAIPESDGRRIQIGWMNGGVYPQMPFSQQMTFPCELKLRAFPEGLRLCKTPVKEIAGLREKARRWRGLLVQPGENPLTGLFGELFDIQAEFEIHDAEAFGLKVRGEAVRYRVNDRTLSVLGRSAPLGPDGERVQLRLLVDRASLEVFGNEGRVALSSCFLPRAEEREVALFAEGGAVRVVSLVVYPLRSAWRTAG